MAAIYLGFKQYVWHNGDDAAHFIAGPAFWKAGRVSKQGHNRQSVLVTTAKNIYLMGKQTRIKGKDKKGLRYEQC